MKKIKIFHSLQLSSTPLSFRLTWRNPLFYRVAVTMKGFLDPPRRAGRLGMTKGKFEIRNPKGFTLIELMVSVAISGILMVGISIFFSSTFRNMFQAQTQAQNTGKQFVMNEILRNKFMNMESVVEGGNEKDYLISFNKNVKGQMPFTYIGKNEDNKLVFKDFMLFNKMDVLANSPHLFADSGNGQINKATGGPAGKSLVSTDKFKNFSSFVRVNNTYYVTLPHENKVMKVDCSSNICSSPTKLDFKKYQLKSPTDVVVDKDKKYIYISDSENGRIIRYNTNGPSNKEKIIGPKLKYPTGLAYYYDATDKKEWLFVAETLNNKVIKINLTAEGTPTTVVGDGEYTACDKISATLCKLNMPTGLYVNVDESVKPKIHELYIADSGNNRILKMSDPGTPTKLIFKIDADKNYALNKITFENSNWTEGKYLDNFIPVAPYTMLIGKGENYNKSTKTFSSTETLKTFVNSKCKSSTNAFYVDGDINNIGIKTGDTLIAGDKEKITLTVASSWSTENCNDDSKSNASVPKGKISVEEDASKITDGLTIYPANPKNIEVQIDKPTITISSGESGLQQFTIKIYDAIKGGLAYTAYQTERIGDEKIGTPEDVIEVVAKNTGNTKTIKFPTGVTNTYFANSGGGKICPMSNNPTCNTELKNISTNFKSFDYTSDFDLVTEKPIEFKEYNDKKILEMTITTKTDATDSTKTQTYKLNATLSK